MTTIAVVGTLDTKGQEHAYLAQRIQSLGCKTLIIDVGTGGPPSAAADISREDVLGVRDDAASLDRGAAVSRMASAIPVLLRRLQQQEEIQGVISLGGSGGTAIATAGMRALPLGLPKVMVSTLASGNVAQYVDVSDIVMFPSIVDVSGLNRVLRGVLARAAAAVVAMARAQAAGDSETVARPLIVASMFGNTTPCVDHARGILESQGYEVLVFHATGTGGRTMEALIRSGQVAGVLDITTTEWADQLVGGVMPGGTDRLSAAACMGVPSVVAPGCLDMVNFGEPSTIPEVFRHRTFHRHNPQVTLMRTTPQECEELGKLIAGQLNRSTGPVCMLFPTKSTSMISAAGQAFHDPKADRSLLDSLRRHLRADIPFETIDCDINDPVFAETCVQHLLREISGLDRDKNTRFRV
jgi:uncharacterized protein (UPF0261 family)